MKTLFVVMLVVAGLMLGCGGGVDTGYHSWIQVKNDESSDHAVWETIAYSYEDTSLVYKEAVTPGEMSHWFGVIDGRQYRVLVVYDCGDYEWFDEEVGILQRHIIVAKDGCGSQ